MTHSPIKYHVQPVPYGAYILDDYDLLIAKVNSVKKAKLFVKAVNIHEELVQAAKGMLENYIQLKRISLAVARSDNPDWMPSLTEDGDIHVIAIRKAIAKAEEKE